jgi:LuxR family maltose regulon positive regulatory protein
VNNLDGVEALVAIPRVPLVRSKLLVPSPAGLLHRPRLCQVIERGLDCKLTLISAPAGYGKTSVLVDFAQRAQIPVCWYTADERERDLGLFAEYLAGAINEQFSGFSGQALAAATSSTVGSAGDPVGVAEGLANGILELEKPLVLVLDNFESLDGTLGIRGFVRRFIEILPPNCHLMIGSRALPDIPITHLVAKRQLVGLASHHLRFTAEEIRELLALSQIDVTEAQSQAIAANSEGWITGVLLLADLLREDVQLNTLVSGQVTSEAYGYLAAEVLDRQPPDVQHFLSTSSVLREMTAPMCREVLQITDPEGLLAEIERRNLFVTRFGAGPGATFRYHNLFRGFLHQRLQVQNSVSFDDLHLRAAAWFDGANDVEETVYHYLTAEAYPQATALMERVAGEWFVRGRVETLLRWSRELPEPVKAQAPRLLLYQGRVLTNHYDFEGARQALVYAEEGFATREGRVADLAEVHNLRAVSELFQGRYESAIVEAETALEMLSGEEDVIERVNARRYIGKAYVGLGQLEEGAATLREALASYRRLSSPYEIVNTLQDIGDALLGLGRLDEAGTCLSEALTVVRRLGASVSLAVALNNLGYLYHLRGDYQQSLALFEEGLAVARRAGDLKNQAYIALGIADVYRDIGAYDRAEPLYRVARQLAEETEPSHAVYVLLAQADMRRWQGDPEGALALLKEGRRLAEEQGLGFEVEGLLPLSEGIALAESGEVGAGIRAISGALDFLGHHQAKREVGRGYFLLARAYLLTGDEQQAVAALRQAMDAAEQTGTCQFAVAEGQHAPALLQLGVEEKMTMCRQVLDQCESFQIGRGRMRLNGEEYLGEGSYLEIRGFGEGQVVRDGRVLTSADWRAAMAKELFFYILLHGPLERDAIGAVFWPELSTRKMRNSFHTTLHRMRGAVGSQAVVVEEGVYRLGDVDYWFDVHEFEALVARARLLPPHDWQTEDLWRRALALYKGDFMPEVERMWCVPRREALREMYIEALIGLGRSYEARQDLHTAVDWYQKALDADELREDVYRRVMRCYAESGQRSRALAQYARCVEMLREQLGLEPAAETRQLYEQIAGAESG